MQTVTTQAWRDRVNAFPRLSAAHKRELLGLVDHLYSEMDAADKHYADGYFEPAIPPFKEVEESTRGRCAMIQYNATTHTRIIKRLCEDFQNLLKSWIDDYARRLGYRLPLHWEP